MSQALLRDRFRLDASYERVEVPVYALVIERSDGKVGPNLRASASLETCNPDPLVRESPDQPVKVLPISSCGVAAVLSSGGLTAVMGTQVTMTQLARSLSGFGKFGRTVIDRTGLSGEFDMSAVVSADIAGATSEARFLTAMREQLGLTLRSEQGNLDVLRIRRIEQPSPN
jgi:uncharacterized protein (TIGR03435 family)